MLRYAERWKESMIPTGAVFEGEPVFRSPRVDALRTAVMDAVPEIAADRAVLVTESYRQTEAEAIPIRRAKAMKNTMEHLAITIRDGELIVGEVGNRLRCAQIYPEFDIQWVIDELDGNPVRFEQRPGDRYIITEADEKQLREIAPYWQGKTHHDRVKARMPRDAWAAYQNGIISTEFLMISGEGHVVVNLRRVLREDLNSFAARAQERLDALDLAEPEDMRKMDFLRAAVICCQAACTFAARYAALAEELAAAEPDPIRRAELEKIASVCRRVPAEPARDIHEAIQCVYFINTMLQIENNGQAVSFGRLDQTLYPYYRQARQEGLDDDDIAELLGCFYVKLYQLCKITPWSNTRSFLGYITTPNITVGGQDKNGVDCANDLTYLILRCQAMIKLKDPSISARYHDRASDRYMNALLDINKLGGGQPAYYSDETYVPALVNRGIAWEDAVEYSIVGCAEAIIEGKQSTRPNGAAFINFGKIMELALNNGTDPATGVCLHKGMGDLTTFRSYDEVYAAFKDQLAYYIRMHVINDNLIDMVTEEGISDPFVSLLIDDCIGRGKTVKQGGAIYDYCGPLYVGIANVGNSLAALKKVVFEDQRLTGAQVAHALRTNYEDMTTTPTGPEIRKLLLSDPKYGNDDDYVDSIMVDYFRYACEETCRYKTTRYGRGPIGGKWQPSTSSVSSNVPMGECVGALPDGRKSGEALADTTSPSHGTDVNGPTASLKSVGKLPNVLVSGGQLLNLRIDPASVRTPEGRGRVIAMLRTFLGDLKGMHIQFNMVSKETLLDAQKHPEQYRDLLVRVAGYSAQFTPIDKALQDDIIARTEHSM